MDEEWQKNLGQKNDGGEEVRKKERNHAKTQRRKEFNSSRSCFPGVFAPLRENFLYSPNSILAVATEQTRKNPRIQADSVFRVTFFRGYISFHFFAPDFFAFVRLYFAGK